MTTLAVDQRLQFHEQRMLKYAVDDGSESEVVWNSRLGFVPLEIRSWESGRFMKLVEVGELKPDYVPIVGERVITDMTEQRARVIAAQCLQEASDALESRQELQSMFDTREEAMEEFYLAIRGCDFDLLTVTSGFIEELQEYRKNGTPLTVSEGMIDPDPAEKEEETEYCLHYDRQGKKISQQRYLELFEDASYRILAKTTINDDAFVSTIWMGLDHGFDFGNTKPVIFETMIFRRCKPPKVGLGGRQHDFDGEEQWRYCTEAEAFAGHERACQLARSQSAGRQS